MCCFGALAPSPETDKTGVGKSGNRQLTKQFLEETKLNNKFKHAMLQGVWNLMPIYLIAKSTVKSALRRLCKKGQFDEFPPQCIYPAS